MENEITVAWPLVEIVLQEAAEREISVEEIVSEAIKNYLERSADRG